MTTRKIIDGSVVWSRRVSSAEIKGKFLEDKGSLKIFKQGRATIMKAI